jgi:FkbM family methyltransferase
LAPQADFCLHAENEATKWSRQMNFIDNLKKPEYIFRPSQIIIRLWHGYTGFNKLESVRLPWGLDIKIQPEHSVGRSIWTVGVADPTVCEVLMRLTDPGETVVDVGANIGYMSSIMASRVGDQGKVIAFEPHPEAFNILRENVVCWENSLGPRFLIYPLALSNYNGEALLGVPDKSNRDSALASIVTDKLSPATTIQVRTRRLDDLIKDQIGVLKIDIEGHELMALQGATELISRHQIRDIVFEEHRCYPTPVTRFLEDHGYTVFNLGQTLFGLKVTPASSKSFHREWNARSCLATIDPARALQRLKTKGWTALRQRRIQ